MTADPSALAAALYWLTLWVLVSLPAGVMVGHCISTGEA